MGYACLLYTSIIDNATGKPYLKPYEVLERDGVRIAVLGMITPAIQMCIRDSLPRTAVSLFVYFEGFCSGYVQSVQQHSHVHPVDIY